MKRILLFLFPLLLFAATVSCSQLGEKEIAVESVTLSQPTAEMLIGETIKLVATVLPGNASDKSVNWASSKQSVATVTPFGEVKALEVGTSTITASCSGKSATCVVTVSKGAVQVVSVSLDRSECKLSVGDETVLTATVAPDNATDKAVSWQSSNPLVASVDQGGRVKGLSEGKATVTATAGGQSASCEVTVSQDVVPVASVGLDRTSVTLEEKQRTQLIATVSPGDATDKTVTWSTSDPSVATVDQEGWVTAVKEGSATVTAKAGAQSAKCSVTVQNKVIPVTSISISKSSLQLTKGQSETLTATVSPSDATDKTVTWSSSDATVASVTKDGKVTGLKGGNVTVTAKAGEKSAQCSVTVTVPVEDVSLDRTSVTLEEKQTTTLVATVSPSDATDKTVTWSSSDSDVATVDQNGKVTAIKEGVATVKAEVGGKSATCSVTVSKAVVPVSSISLDVSRLDLVVGGTATLTATVAPDDATDKTITWSSTDATVVSVDQKGKVTALKGGTATITAKAGEKSANALVDVMEVTPATLEVDGEGESFDVTVITTRSYHVSSKPDWITEKSVEKQVHHFEAVPNDKTEERTGIIVFCDDVGSCIPCEVKQKGNFGLAVTPEELSFELEGGEDAFSVVTALGWTASSNASWCRVSPGSGTGKGTVKVTVDAYRVVGDRNAVITVKAGDVVRTVSISQHGVIPFSVSPASVDLGEEGGSFEVSVSGSYGYHVSGMPEWISQTSVKDRVHTFQATANSALEVRSGVVTFCDDEGTCLSVFVQQAAHVRGPDEVDWTKEFYHRSLFMRFTATWCGWCPRMASAVKLAQQQDPGKIEAISLHGGGSKLVFQAGSTLETTYGINGYPSGVLDGRKQIANYAMETTAGYISEGLRQREAAYPTVSAIGWTSSFSGQKLSIETHVFIKEPGNYKYTVLLVEDGIVGYQADFEVGDHQDYRHDGVVRVAVTDISGEAFSTSSSHTVKSKAFTVNLPSSYKKENLRILVYVQRAYGSLSKIEASDYDGYFVDNCASGKAGGIMRPAVISEAGGGNEDFIDGKPINW